MIDRITVDKILDAAQIVDVVSDFVTLRKAGVNYKGLCPFHDDRTPSFVVSPAKGLCKCFACGKGGNAVHFIMEHEQLSYPDALRYLARKYHIEIKERELTDDEKQAQSERESMFVINEWACKFFQDQLKTTDGQAFGLSYFRSRGFRDDIIKKFQLGYCPTQRDACYKAAISKGFNEEYLLKTGLCYKKDNGQIVDRFWGRVIFPVQTISGKIVAFGGRVLDAATKGVNVKYQNSPESAIYSKKKELYGLYLAKQAIVKNDLCFLVEGYTDVISMHQMGVENVVSSSGTALTTDQIRMIHRFTENITVLYDGDAAGIKASERGIDMLLAEGMNVKLLLLPDGDDPDSFARKHHAAEYQEYLKTHQVDFIRYKTELLLSEAQGDPIKLSRLINSIVQSISVVPDDITRSVYIKESASILGMEERLLVSAVSQHIAKAKEEQQKNRENERRRAQDAAITEGQPEHTQVTENTDTANETNTANGNGLNTTPSPTPATQSSDAPEVTASLLSFIPQKGTEQLKFYQKEILLVQMIIKYGEMTMCYMEDENGKDCPVSVVEYISGALEEDGLSFHVPLHKQIMNEALTHLHDEKFCAERYFLNHPDQAVSTLAFNLSSEKYQLSKYHTKNQKLETDEERLIELVPHLISDFKLSIIDEELKQILMKLRDPNVFQNKTEYMSIMQHYKEVKEIESALARQRGDRVITL